MKLFSKRKHRRSLIEPVFDKNKIIIEILEKRPENCPEWIFLNISKEPFGGIQGDFIAIYTDIINKEVIIKGNPFSEYKNTVESIYQIVREVYITDQDFYNEHNNIFKSINVRSAKELFIKLKKEQE
jgi:hypothetical protein